MLFNETGNKDYPTIILLHGGGLSDWSLSGIVELLKEDYHVVTPIIEGHGENGNETFISIEKSTDMLLDYIDRKRKGKVFALGGLSIGAQIVTEALSRRDNIADFAILESALVLPMKITAALTVPTYNLFYGLIKMKWFSNMQAKTLFIPENMFELYYCDSLKMSKQSLINITLSNLNYTLKNSIENTKAKVLIIVGEKESGIMKKSAQILNDRIPGSTLYLLQNMGHGELGLVHPQMYIEILKRFITK